MQQSQSKHQAQLALQDRKPPKTQLWEGAAQLWGGVTLPPQEPAPAYPGAERASRSGPFAKTRPGLSGGRPQRRPVTHLQMQPPQISLLGVTP